MDDQSLKRKHHDGTENVHTSAAKAPRTDSHYGMLFNAAQHEDQTQQSTTAGFPQASHTSHLQIDYLARQQAADVSLLDPNTDSLPTCVSILNQYTSVLERSESLANNLGARPLSSIYLQRFERMFDGPPQVISAYGHRSQPSMSWLDVAHASLDPIGVREFDDVSENKRVVQFEAKGCTVQVSWEEWQMVRSGLLQKMMPAQPVAEDEDRELGTLDILEDTVSRVITLADQVAARGRQFNHRLKGRRSAIVEGRQVNGNTPNGLLHSASSPQVRQDLTRLFTANRRHLSHDTQPATPPPTSHARPHSQSNHTPQPSTASPPAHSTTPSTNPKPRRPQPPPQPEGPYKPLLTTRMEMLPKGGRIYPPCDRCRRLQIDCCKNLTACIGCTKKHCKCSWRDVSEEEVARGGLISQGNGVMTGLGPMGVEVGYADVEVPEQVGQEVGKREDERFEGERSDGRQSAGGQQSIGGESANVFASGHVTTAPQAAITAATLGGHAGMIETGVGAQVNCEDMRTHA